MSITGLIILAFVVIIICLPALWIVAKLLNRKPLPEKFQDNDGNIISEKLGKLNTWRKCQTCSTIIGYFVALGLIVFFTLHVLVMSLVMGEKTVDLWLRSLLICFIIDFVLLQTSKGLILRCCLSPDCVDFALTLFAGAMF